MNTNMNNITHRNAARQDFMPLMRELVRAYQAFTSFDAAEFRRSGSGLTTSQADVIFTLGNTDGMSCKEIGKRTLITKGTLTGVLDRLQDRGLVERVRDEFDGRRFQIVLTPAGMKSFEREFPRQIRALKAKFDRISRKDQVEATRLLQSIRRIFKD